MPDGYVIIGNPQSRRVQMFQDALQRLARPTGFVVPWIDLLKGNARIEDADVRRRIARIESPGQDFEVEKALLAEGAESRPTYPSFLQVDRATVQALEFDRGQIHWPRQWFFGFCRALAKLDIRLSQMGCSRRVQCMHDILAMFDKPRCHALLSTQGVSVPQAIPDVRSFADLLEKMRARRWRRAFIKLAFGSSASGVVAYQTDGHRHRATTTVEMVSTNGKIRLYNSRRLLLYEKPAEVESLIDMLCWHGVHVERWIPKAGINGKTFDLRVLTIAGHTRHVVARLSNGPMTNLHLLNDRDTADAVRSRMGEDAWHEAMSTCEKAAACFPDSLHCGVDLLIGTDFKRHAILEMNAFGDLLNGSLDGGMDTYTAEILAMDQRQQFP